MRYISVFLLFLAQNIFAQSVSKDDKKITGHLKSEIGYLADDKLEGRRTGTAGEKLAYEYLEQQFKDAGIQPFFADKNYLQAFDVNDGKSLDTSSSLSIGKTNFILYEDFVPLAFSATGTFKFKPDGSSRVRVTDLTDTIANNKNNPHFDLQSVLAENIKEAEGAGVDMLCFTDNNGKNDDLSFNPKDKTPAAKIPVIFFTKAGDKKFKAIQSFLPYAANIIITEKHRTGHNVIGYINNNAANTIILGAHYDHLGYGEDHNSLYAGKPPLIHNGADDNASGTAALLELGKWLKNSTYKQYNYLLISFSGEELGLFGSKYFTEHPGLDLKTVDYMINMDMVGRLNDSTHGLTVGGFGTSPEWGKLISKNDPYFKINIDSSGVGPSDHTSFYRKDIPVLFFFTGSHKDYHKPTDDADKINYAGELQVIHYIQNIIAATNGENKIAFTKTRDAVAGKNTFKVSLGIMPDYTYSEAGVRVDGVSDNRPAQKAGILTGDVLIQLGDYKFTDVQTYMDALNKFNKGESTMVKLKRGKEELILPITF